MLREKKKRFGLLTEFIIKNVESSHSFHQHSTNIDCFTNKFRVLEVPHGWNATMLHQGRENHMTLYALNVILC